MRIFTENKYKERSKTPVNDIRVISDALVVYHKFILIIFLQKITWYNSDNTQWMIIYQIYVEENEDIFQWEWYFISCYGEQKLHSTESGGFLKFFYHKIIQTVKYESFWREIF